MEQRMKSSKKQVPEHKRKLRILAELRMLLMEKLLLLEQKIWILRSICIKSLKLIVHGMRNPFEII